MADEAHRAVKEGTISESTEGVYGPPGPAFLAHFIQRVRYIVDLTVLRLAFFMGYK